MSRTARDPSQWTYTNHRDAWPATVAYPSGVSSTTGYDGSGRPTTIAGRGPGGGVLTSFTYSYGGVGNGTSDTVLRHSTQTLSGTTTFSYDGANRPHQAVEALNGGGGDTYLYGYDAADKRTSATVNGAGPSYSYNAADELTSGSAVYDADGNLTAAPGYGYSSFNVNDANKTLSITPNAKPAVTMNYAGATQDHWRQDGNTGFVTAANIGIVAATTAGQASYFTRLPDGSLLGERTPSGACDASELGRGG